MNGLRLVSDQAPWENREACEKTSSLVPFSLPWLLIPAGLLHPQLSHWLLCGLVPKYLSTLGPERRRGGKTQLAEQRPGKVSGTVLPTAQVGSWGLTWRTTASQGQLGKWLGPGP